MHLQWVQRQWSFSVRVQTNRVVGYTNGEFVDYDIQAALAMEKGLDPYLFHITRKLTTY